jgi:hypothetical protein
MLNLGRLPALLKNKRCPRNPCFRVNLGESRSKPKVGISLRIKSVPILAVDSQGHTCATKVTENPLVLG